MTLWLDDVQKQSITFIDNDTRTLTDIRLGAQDVETGTRGTIYFDDFESRRFSYIGTLPDPGVDDPQATNAAGWKANTYTYSATIPHAVTSVAIEGGGTNTYQYDANGNMTCRIENGVVYTHAYNAENRASSIAKRNTDCTGTIIESWSFAYDGDGTRVLTAHFTGTQGTPDSVTSYFMGGQYELKDGAAKKYYSIAGMTVAMHDGSAVQYLLTDHLGSTVAVINSSGTLTSQQRYLPFGGVRSIPNSPILATDFGYTGQRLLDAGMGGIMDYKARFYSVGLGRFIQPDTMIPGTENPQAWNRYSYAYNNPIRYNDPDGHCPICATAVIGAAIGAIVGAVGYTAYVAATGKEFNSKHFWMATGGGAVAGALIGTGVGIAAGVSTASATVAAVKTTEAAAVVATAACKDGDCTNETYTVYRYVEQGITRYYGMTNDFARRAGEWSRTRGWTIEPIIEKLDRFSARAVEQVLIEKDGLANLYNKINSIAVSNPIYPEAIRKGKEILEHLAK